MYVESDRAQEVFLRGEKTLVVSRLDILLCFLQDDGDRVDVRQLGFEEHFRGDRRVPGRVEDQMPPKPLFDSGFVFAAGGRVRAVQRIRGIARRSTLLDSTGAVDCDRRA
jgi:hypothetical protein